MRPPASIKPYLSVEQMLRWLQSAPDEAAYKRRMAICLTHTGGLHAQKVAGTLGVSVQAIRLWVRQYNKEGPAGLERRGRGGRRWAFLSLAQEAEILKPFIQRAQGGSVPKAAQIRPAIERKVGRKVSMPYVYRLLARHNWSQIIAQSHEVTRSAAQDTFSTNARPWQRSF